VLRHELRLCLVLRLCDAEHPTDITMSRVPSASDTCDIYFTYIKVNHLLYTCSLDPFEDGILLDTPLVCMHMYYWSFIDNDEECKHKCTPTPSAKEACERRWKKGDEDGAVAWHGAGHPDDQPDHPGINRTFGLPPGSSDYGDQRHSKACPEAGSSGRCRDHPALPVCMTGHLALYPHLTYPFSLSSIYRPSPAHL